MPRWMKKWSPDKVKKILATGKIDSDSDKSSEGGGGGDDSNAPIAPLPPHHRDRTLLVEELSEQWYDLMFMQTLEARRQVAAERPVQLQLEDFEVFVRGTEDTYRYKKRPYDGVRCQAKSRDATEMMRKYFPQRSFTYDTLKKFSLKQATVLAWMANHRLQYFLDIWRESKCSPVFRFRQEHIDNYRMLESHAECIQQEPDDSTMFERVQQLEHDIVPPVY